MFSQFAGYDDEGFFDYSFRLFLGGHALYGSVFSDYGPFYYELFGGFFRLVGQSPTTDAGRLIQLVIWLSSSLGIGLAAHRLTGRLTLGVVSLVAAFSLLGTLVVEPMHPAGLITLQITAFVCFVVFWLPRSARGACGALGGLAAALTLTKINVGGYVVIGMAFAIVMTGSSLYRAAVGRIPVLRVAVIAAFVGVGPLVMAGDLGHGWTRRYALIALLSAGALALVVKPARASSADGSANIALHIGVGFVVVFLGVLLVMSALGSTPVEWFRNAVLVASHQAHFLTVPIAIGPGSVALAVISALAAVLLRVTPRLAGRFPDGVGSGLRLLVGLAILLSVSEKFSTFPAATIAIPMPLAWVAALPSARDSRPRDHLVRVLLPSVAIAYGLLAYPVAGSQLRLGAALFVLCGAVCVADGWSELLAMPAARRVRTRLSAAVSLGFAGWLVATCVVVSAGDYHSRFAGRSGIRLPGVSLLHLPTVQRVAFEGVVSSLHAHGCRALISLPGLYSFNLWSGLPTPAPRLGAQPFWRVLSGVQQAAVLRAARSSAALCAVRDDMWVRFYGQRNTPRVPLVAFIADDFVPVAQYGDYRVEVRRSAGARRDPRNGEGGIRTRDGA